MSCTKDRVSNNNNQNGQGGLCKSIADKALPATKKLIDVSREGLAGAGNLTKEKVTEIIDDAKEKVPNFVQKVDTQLTNMTKHRILKRLIDSVVEQLNETSRELIKKDKALYEKYKTDLKKIKLFARPKEETKCRPKIDFIFIACEQLDQIRKTVLEKYSVRKECIILRNYLSDAVKKVCPYFQKPSNEHVSNEVVSNNNNQDDLASNNQVQHINLSATSQPENVIFPGAKNSPSNLESLQNNPDVEGEPNPKESSNNSEVAPSNLDECLRENQLSAEEYKQLNDNKGTVTEAAAEVIRKEGISIDDVKDFFKWLFHEGAPATVFCGGVVAVGALIGGLAGGPLGALIGGAIGGALGGGLTAYWYYSSD